MADVEVTATGNVDPLLDSMEKAAKSGTKMAETIEKEGKKGSEGFGESVGKMVEGAKKIVEGLALIEGAKKAFEFGKSLVEAASEAQVAGAQTEAVLKSTGEAAGLTSKGVDELTESLAQHNGVSEESARSATNMLLTFRDVRNEAGKGNDIFNQASQATQDMARAMGMDGRSAALQLGKALNDPAQGMGRLQRIGVTFTDSQVKAAKAMEAAGNTAGAQKIVLGELNKEFGGSGAAFADTYAGKMEKLKDSVHELKVGMGEQLLPIITSAAGVANKGLQWLEKAGVAEKFGEGLKAVGGVFRTIGSEVGPPLIKVLQQTGSSFMSEIGPSVKTLLPLLLQLATSVSPVMNVFKALEPVLPILGGLLGTIADLLSSTLSTALKVVVPIVQSLSKEITGFASGVLAEVLPVVAELVQALGPVLTDIMKALMPIVGTLGGVLSEVLGAAFSILTPLITAVVGIIRELLPVIMPVIDQIVKMAGSIAQQLAPILTQLIRAVLPLVLSTFKLLEPAIQPVVKIIGTTLTDVIRDLMPVVKTVFNALGPIIKDAVGIITGIVEVFTGLLTGNWSKVWDGLGKIVSGAFSALWDILKGAGAIFVSAVKGLLNAGWDVLKGAVKTVASLAGNIVLGLINGVKSNASGFGKSLMDMVSGGVKAVMKFLGIASPSKLFQTIGNWVNKGFANGITGTASQVIQAMRDLATKVADVPSKVMSTAKKNALLDTIAGDSKKLDALAKDRDAVAARLKTANDKLQSAEDTRNSYKATVTTGVEGLGQVTNAQGKTDADGNQLAVTASDIIAQKQATADATNKFMTELASLQKEGLNQADYKSLVDSFQSSGDTSYADALSAGGQSAVDQVNKLQTQITSAATQLGTTTSSTLYQAGVDSAQAVVDGLKAKQDVLDAGMGTIEKGLASALSKAGIDSGVLAKKAGNQIGQGLAEGIKATKDAINSEAGALGKSLVKELKKELGIKSPSKVADEEVGQMFGAGVVIGLGKSEAGVAAAARRLVAVPSMDSGDVAPAMAGSAATRASSGGSGGDAPTVQHVWNINVPPKADRDDTEYAENLMRQVRFTFGSGTGGGSDA